MVAGHDGEVFTERDRGEIRIAFYSNDDFERVLALLGTRLD